MGAELSVMDLLEHTLIDGRVPASKLDPALARLSQLWHSERPVRWFFSPGVRRRGWRMLLQAHPHACPQAPPMLLVARMASRDCGMMVCTPARVQTPTGWLPAHWGVDFYVPSSLRAQGVGEALLRAWLLRSPLALGLGIADPAWSVAKRMGWIQVATVSRWVLNLEHSPVRSPLPASLPSAIPSESAGDPALTERFGQDIRTGQGIPIRCWNGLPPGIAPLLEQLRTRQPLHLSRDARFLDWRYPGTRRALPLEAFLTQHPPRFVGVTVGNPQSPDALALLELQAWGPFVRVMRLHELLAGSSLSRQHLLHAARALGRFGHFTRLTARAASPELEHLLLQEGFQLLSPTDAPVEHRVSLASDRFVLNSSRLDTSEHTDPTNALHGLLSASWMLSSGDSGNVF